MNVEALTSEFEPCKNGTSIADADLVKMKEVSLIGKYDIVIAGRLLQTWKNGKVKKDIIFEQVDGNIHPLATNPPPEPGPFLKERWNPFNSFFIFKKAIWNEVPSELRYNPDLLLKYVSEKNLKVFIDTKYEATEIITFSIKDDLRKTILSSYILRKIILRISITLSNIRSFICNKKERDNYYRKIEKIKIDKEIVLSLSFGGIGDCLSYSTLPRLLKEQYDVDFYLDAKSKSVFRHEDTFNLCFGLNPYFKGFKECDDPFILKDFAPEKNFSGVFSAHTNETAVAKIEKQFNLIGTGLPEIYYKPKAIVGYENTLFCDKNWFSGQKWGLYNDPQLIEEGINEWLKYPSHAIEYSDPAKQNLFEYIDKLYSAGKFLCYFSGGNALAASLGVPATVVVPENLDGNSLAIYLFKESNINYIRKCSLAKYFIL